MSLLYTDNDAKVCAWLAELVRTGNLPPGEVLCSDVTTMSPVELLFDTQAHFFAGIGGWPLALQMAGWPSNAPVWTGSCPCQPFSSAGKRKGYADDRHLWPYWRDLIAKLKPPIVFGEQVASKAGREWLTVVRAEMEAMGYAVGAADLCASSVGAPHIRQRLFFGAARLDDAHIARRKAQWARGIGAGEVEQIGLRNRETERVADCSHDRRGQECTDAGGGSLGNSPQGVATRPVASGDAERLADGGAGSQGYIHRGGPRATSGSGSAKRMADTDGGQSGRAGPVQPGGEYRQQPQDGCAVEGHDGPTRDNPWRGADFLYCRDGKLRPVEPGTFPLADGVSGRVVRLRGYGNAVVPQLAAQFILSFMEALNDH